MIGRSLWRFLLRTPWSAGLTLVGITLGIVSIVAVHLISAQVATQLDGLLPGPVSEFTHTLHRDDLESSDYFALRREWRQGKFDFIERLAPIIDEQATLADTAVRVLGVDLLGNPPLGSNLDTAVPGEVDWRGVWIDASLGDVVSLPVNGILTAPAGTLIADIGVVQDLLGWRRDRLSYVAVRAVDPLGGVKASMGRLLPGADAGWPASALPEIPGWRSMPVADAYPASQFGRSVLFNVGALGALALLVAWFLIYQVAVAWLRRLWGVFERLHVLGVDHAAVRNHFLLMLCAFGGIAGVLGLLLGRTLAVRLYAATLGPPIPALDIDVWLALKAMISAVVVCVLAGWWAYRQNQQPQQWAAWARLLIAALVLASILYGVGDEASGLVGAFTVIALLSLSATALIAPALRALRSQAARVRGSYLLRMTLRELSWFPRELSVAIGGLGLALATAIGVGVMVDSFRADFSQMLDRRLAFDWTVTGDPLALASLVETLDGSTEVGRVQAYRVRERRVADIAVEVVSTRLDAAEAARYGVPRALQPGEALIGEQTSRLLGIDRGDAVRIGERSYRVAGIFQSFGDMRPRLIVDGLDAEGTLRSVGFDLVRRDEVLPPRVRRALEGLEPVSQRELRATALETFDRTFAITTILIAIAILVAAIGVYIALTSLRLNQRISARLLADMGVNRWENWGVDFARGVGVGICAVIVALPLGLLFGWILCDLVNPRAFGWTVAMRLEALPIVWPVLWGVAAAALAGMIRVGRGEEGALGGG